MHPVLLEPLNSVVIHVASVDSPNDIQLSTKLKSEISVSALLASCLIVALPQAVASLLGKAKGDDQNVTQLGMDEPKSPNFKMAISM